MSSFQYLKISHVAGPDVVDLLEKNLVGTPGKSMIYGHTDMQGKLSGLQDYRFVNLFLGTKLIGTICLIRRSVLSEQQEHKTIYVRYFTFHELFRSSGNTARKGKRNSIRQEIDRLMDGEGLEAGDNPFLYAYVDANNVRSKRLIDEFGFHMVATFYTIPYSRFFPKRHEEVQRLGSDQEVEIRRTLMDFYRHFNLVTLENLFTRGHYYAVKKDGRFVCGVEAIPDSWNVISLPGLAGKVMMNVVPYIPVLRRAFKADYKFLFFENIFCLPGYEHLLDKLFDTALADMKRYSAILCQDPTSELYTIISKINKGLTHRINGEMEITVMVKSKQTGTLSPGKPFFVSGADVL